MPDLAGALVIILDISDWGRLTKLGDALTDSQSAGIAQRQIAGSGKPTSLVPLSPSGTDEKHSDVIGFRHRLRSAPWPRCWPAPPAMLRRLFLEYSTVFYQLATASQEQRDLFQARVREWGMRRTSGSEDFHRLF